MKIESKKLAAALSKVIGIVGRRTTLPILGCVLIQSRENTLEITATDLDCWATAKCECDGKLDPVCVSGRLLHGLIQNAPEWVSITIEGNRLIVEGNGRAGVSYLEAKEFPPFPINKLKKIGVNPVDLADCIEGVAWAAKPKSIDRPKLQTINILLSAKSIRCEASDGHVLSRMTRALIATDAEFMLPVAVSGLVCECLRGENATVELSENWLVVHSDSLVSAARLFDGKYYNLDQMVKVERESVGSVSIADLIRAFSTIVGLAKDKDFCPAVITPHKKELVVEFQDDVNEFKVALDGKFSGNPFRLSAALGEKFLRACPDPDNAKLDRTDMNSIIVESGDYLAVLMLLSEKVEAA